MKPIRVTAAMIDAAVGELGCMSDERCQDQWHVMTCNYCREKAKRALEAVFEVVKARRMRTKKGTK